MNLLRVTIFEHKKMDVHGNAYGPHRGIRQNDVLSYSIFLLRLQWEKKKKMNSLSFLLGIFSGLFIFYMARRNTEPRTSIMTTDA